MILSAFDKVMLKKTKMVQFFMTHSVDGAVSVQYVGLSVQFGCPEANCSDQRRRMPGFGVGGLVRGTRRSLQSGEQSA